MAVRKSSGSGRRYRKGNNAGLVVLGVCLMGAAWIITGGGKSTPADTTTTQAAPVVAQFDTVQVPVPTAPVAAGTRMRDVKIQMVSFPAHQVPGGAVRDLSPYSEAIAVTPLPGNLPIFRENLSLAGGATNPVIDKIPEGMRAITIRVDATSAVEGWAGTGATVDVMLVQSEGTSVIAEKVKILSAERSVQPVQGGTSPLIPSTVTLLVTQEQSLAINTAIPLGKLAFALRSLSDEGSWGDTRFHTEKLKNLPRSGATERISGFVQLRDGDEDRSFALTHRGWVPTEAVPQGFLPGTQR